MLWARLGDVDFSRFALLLGNYAFNLYVVAHHRIEGSLHQCLSCISLELLVVISNFDEQTINDGVDMYAKFYFVLLGFESIKVLVDILNDGHEQVDCINIDLGDFVCATSCYDRKHRHEDILHLCCFDSAEVKFGQTNSQVDERFRSSLP